MWNQLMSSVELLDKKNGSTHPHDSKHDASSLGSAKKITAVRNVFLRHRSARLSIGLELCRELFMNPMAFDTVTAV